MRQGKPALGAVKLCGSLQKSGKALNGCTAASLERKKKAALAA